MERKHRRDGLRSGDLAKAAGVSPDTLRHYERRGLLARPRRLESGYRAYSPDAVERVRLIQNALAVGFTLAELAAFLRDRDAGGAPCAGVRESAERRLGEVERRIRELGRFRNGLKKLIREWDRRFAGRNGDERLSPRFPRAARPDGRRGGFRNSILETRGASREENMNRMARLGLAAVFAGASALLAQDPASHCGGDHHAQVDARGDHVMGFDHAKSTHHFRLTPSGGAIEVSANDPEDAKTVEGIRSHLSHIAKKFAAGDFEAPMMIHDRVPPGVPVMQRDRARIDWKYEEIGAGGKVVVTTKAAEDIEAIHQFLRFQIEDHRTGDPTEVK